MEEIRLNSQIAFLRREKNMTQEDLAKALGVTNQAVSKWESSQCCPDIQLLPEIAKLFEVSIDELMGYKEADTFENVYLKIKSLFEVNPPETAFHNAYRLSILLHEAACTHGYKGYVPWDTNKNHGLAETSARWGFSACIEPEGTAVYAGNGIFLSDGASYQSPNASQIRELCRILDQLADRTVLKVLFALYELIMNDFDVYFSIEDIVKASDLSEEKVMHALDKIPVSTKEDENGHLLYRLGETYLHIPPLLQLLNER